MFSVRRLAEELAVNLERIADLKARVNMLECEREREKYAALEAAKAYDRNDEMMQRVHNLEMALQQAHEDYKILSKGNNNMATFKLCAFILNSFIRRMVEPHTHIDNPHTRAPHGIQWLAGEWNKLDVA